MTDTASDCLFCRIAAGEIPAEIVASNDSVVAFRDISPQAPLHVLVVPKAHHSDVGALAAVDPQLLGEIIEMADLIAENEAEGEYRVVFNTGRMAGQSVFHVHAHVLGGRSLAWPPG